MGVRYIFLVCSCLDCFPAYIKLMSADNVLGMLMSPDIERNRLFASQ